MRRRTVDYVQPTADEFEPEPVPVLELVPEPETITTLNYRRAR